MQNSLLGIPIQLLINTEFSSTNHVAASRHGHENLVKFKLSIRRKVGRKGDLKRP